MSESKTIDLYDRARSYEKVLQQLNDHPDEKNKQTIRDFLETYGKTLSLTRQMKYISRLCRLSLELKKDFLEADEADTKRLVKFIDGCGLMRYDTHKRLWREVGEASPTTVAENRKILKVFWRWMEYAKKTPANKRLEGQDIRDYLRMQPFPEAVRGIVARYPKPHQYRATDMLLWSEAVTLSQATKNQRDKALIQSMWESGARLGEILTLCVADVEFKERGGKTTANLSLRESKTRVRTIGLVNSVPSIRDWLRVHPFRADSAAPLFIGYLDEYHNVGKRPEYMTPAAVRRILWEANKTAKIDKRINPHFFRKSRASALANLMNEQEVKAVLGWVQDSRMFRHYSFVNEDKANEKYFLSQGVDMRGKTPQALEEQRPIICGNCGYTNPCGELQCLNCHNAFGKTKSPKTQETDEIITEVLARVRKELGGKPPA
jgi:integrase